MNLIRLRGRMQTLHEEIWKDILAGDYHDARESLVILELMAEDLPPNNQSTTVQAVDMARKAIEEIEHK